MVELTPNEHAAIVFHVVENCDDWKKLYIIAKGPNSDKTPSPSSLGVLVSRWKNSDKIQAAIAEIRHEYDGKKARFRDMILAGSESKPIEPEPEKRPKRTDITNFLDRDEFLQFLNSRANEIQDDKLRNDILKMLSDNLRYKDTESAENTDIQRFYTPILCQNCSIYKAAKGEK